jgi:ribosomal protein S12 methylthiotransferase accessory factor
VNTVESALPLRGLDVLGGDSGAQTLRVAGSALRTRQADDTFDRIEPYLLDFGITRVANVTGLDRVGIPCHVAHKPMGTSLSNGSGKGLTPEASRISAVMEAIEQSYWEAAPTVSIASTARRLRADGLEVVDCDAIPRMRYGLWNDDLELDWSPMVDLVTGDDVWVPTEVIHVLLPSRRGAPTFIMGSNGLASGNTLEEAILSGLNELIERDANALHTLRGPDTHEHTFDVRRLCADVGDPLSELVDAIDRAELQLDILDHTSDLGVPTYNAFVHDLAMTRSGTFGGLGTNLDPVVALCRAVTEAVQSRTLIIAGARDDGFGSGRHASMLASQHWVVPPAGSVHHELPVNRSTGSILGDVTLLVERLRAAGLQRVLVHRYTDPRDMFQVVRVVVPGLEGYRFERYQPGPRGLAVLAGVSS